MVKVSLVDDVDRGRVPGRRLPDPRRSGGSTDKHSWKLECARWDFGSPVGRAGPAKGGGELTIVRVIVNDGKVVTAFPY